MRNKDGDHVGEKCGFNIIAKLRVDQITLNEIFELVLDVKKDQIFSFFISPSSLSYLRYYLSVFYIKIFSDYLSTAFFIIFISAFRSSLSSLSSSSSNSEWVSSVSIT